MHVAAARIYYLFEAACLVVLRGDLRSGLLCASHSYGRFERLCSI